MLFKIYNWFTKGFDPADLQETKALIESLKHWIIERLISGSKKTMSP